MGNISKIGIPVLVAVLVMASAAERHAMDTGDKLL